MTEIEFDKLTNFAIKMITEKIVDTAYRTLPRDQADAFLAAFDKVWADMDGEDLRRRALAGSPTD